MTWTRQQRLHPPGRHLDTKGPDLQWLEVLERGEKKGQTDPRRSDRYLPLFMRSIHHTEFRNFPIVVPPWYNYGEINIETIDNESCSTVRCTSDHDPNHAILRNQMMFALSKSETNSKRATTESSPLKLSSLESPS